MPAAHNKESEDLEYWQEKLPQPSRQQNGSAHCKPDNDATRPAGKSKTLKKTPKQKSGKQASKQPGPAQPSPRQPGSGVASERTQWLPFIRKYLYRRSRSITTLASNSVQRTANEQRNNRKGQQVFHVFLFCPICP
ncbi:hypothetical protein QR685DRAFT_432020 [Neurospora intermedia]|uniref:Uncharacterized protein n=1 Tax=Neurospora intermedia TaxID=5142 RepID=A0ABR3DPS1_NEUIN